MDTYRRTGTNVKVQAMRLDADNIDDIRMLVPDAVVVDEKDPFTEEIFKAVNIPTPSGTKRLSQGQFLISYGGQFEVAMPGWFQRNYIPDEVPEGLVPRDVRDSKILRAHEVDDE